MSVAPPAAPSATGSTGQAVRHLGRFQLLRLLGKTQQTMQWLVVDPTSGQELMLVIPRQRLDDEDEMARWLAQARRAARVEHPGVLPPVEVDQQEHYPYLAYERQAGALLAERMGRHGLPAADLVPGAVQLLEGLAFAHEAGLVHRDLHAGMVVITDSGVFKLIGLGATRAAPDEGPGTIAQRQVAERDVLAMGLLLHHALVGRPVLEEPDPQRAIARMAPLGREVVRLPWTDTQAIADPLRAIVNRATDRQERQRYRSARTFARALSGWWRTTGDAAAGPMALLMDRLRIVGLLPAGPGSAQRARRLVALERERTEDIALGVLEDLGLSFELLRAVNVATQRVGAVAANGPILTVRRAIEMLGLYGVRRAATVLKAWPGPLNDAQAADLAHQLELARLAGMVARWVRPAGYDAELVFLLAAMQRMGRLVAQYHFPDEAAQIRRLMQPLPPAQRGGAEEPGMSEQSASFAVLGIDLDALTMGIGRYWGFDESALQLMRRQPLDSPVHHPETDIECLRLSASCANEVIDAQHGPPHRRAQALQHVAQRYARALGVSLLEIQQCAAGIPPEERESGEGPAGTTARAVPSGAAAGLSVGAGASSGRSDGRLPPRVEDANGLAPSNPNLNANDSAVAQAVDTGLTTVHGASTQGAQGEPVSGGLAAALLARRSGLRTGDPPR